METLKICGRVGLDRRVGCAAATLLYECDLALSLQERSTIERNKYMVVLVVLYYYS